MRYLATWVMGFLCGSVSCAEGFDGAPGGADAQHASGAHVSSGSGLATSGKTQAVAAPSSTSSGALDATSVTAATSTTASSNASVTATTTGAPCDLGPMGTDIVSDEDQYTAFDIIAQAKVLIAVAQPVQGPFEGANQLGDVAVIDCGRYFHARVVWSFDTLEKRDLWVSSTRNHLYQSDGLGGYLGPQDLNTPFSGTVYSDVALKLMSDSAEL